LGNGPDAATPGPFSDASPAEADAADPTTSDAGSFTDVTTGHNDPAGGGKKCGGDYLCVAGPGYDAPTGVGVPNGLAGF